MVDRRWIDRRFADETRLGSGFREVLEVFSQEQRPDRHRGRRLRSGGQSSRLALENLETRQLMAYSAFGYSLPQLAVTGYAAPSASYNGVISVDIDVENRGASSLVEPTNLAPGSLSSADVLTTTVQVYASATPNAKSGFILLGTVTTPEIRQNSDYETVATLPTPTKQAGFPADKFYLTLVVNNNHAVLQNSTAGNVYHIPKAVQIVSNPLPDLQVVGFDIPQPLQPGDVVSPTIRIQNDGVGNPGTQGGVTVALVASLDKNFGVGDSILATFTIPTLPGISEVPTQTSIANANNLFTTPNEFTTTLAAVQLPTTPGFYYLGIKIDPGNLIKQTYAPTAALSSTVPVGPADHFLTPTTVLVSNTTAPVFPNLPVTYVNATGLGQTPQITPITTTSLTAASVGPVSPKVAKSLKSHRHR